MIDSTPDFFFFYHFQFYFVYNREVSFYIQLHIIGVDVAHIFTIKWMRLKIKNALETFHQPTLLLPNMVVVLSNCITKFDCRCMHILHVYIIENV